MMTIQFQRIMGFLTITVLIMGCVSVFVGIADAGMAGEDPFADASASQIHSLPVFESGGYADNPPEKDLLLTPSSNSSEPKGGAYYDVDFDPLDGSTGVLRDKILRITYNDLPCPSPYEFIWTTYRWGLYELPSYNQVKDVVRGGTFSSKDYNAFGVCYNYRQGMFQRFINLKRNTNYLFYVNVTGLSGQGSNFYQNYGYFTTGNSYPRSEVSVFRPSAHKFYLKNGTTLTTVIWGSSTDLPVTGDWNGDGLTEVGIFKPSTHKFYLKNGTKAIIVNWGSSTDSPGSGKWR
jgi:hypothetical protein